MTNNSFSFLLIHFIV